MPLSSSLIPNARDPIIDAATGQLTEVWRTFIRLLASQVGALAPITARYWTSTSDPTLSNEQNLGALASGYLKLAVAIGIATPSTVATIPQADITGLAASLAALRSLTPRVTGALSSATPTPNADTTDLYSLTAQAAAAAFGNPTGTPLNGQPLQIRIKDNGTARALTWGTAYVAGGVALPATTVLSKILTLGFLYNTDNALNKWQLIASAQEV
jgi:hypothetical protein